jgi:hypothetical protein
MKQTLIEFPEPESEDRLMSIRCVMWALAFEVALDIAVALAWSLRHSFR